MLPLLPIKCLNKRAFVRADLNVPLTPEGMLQSDAKLVALAPTLDYLLQAGASAIIIGTHLGRPVQQQGSDYSYDQKLSTAVLLPWLIDHGYKTTLANTLDEALHLSTTSNSDQQIILLENLRFFAGERSNDQIYLHNLKALADVYVNEAFGLIHRSDASVTELPKLFTPANRTAGLLIAKERAHLDVLKHRPNHPLVLLIGGSKAQDKIPLLANFLIKPHADTILTGGLLAQAFLAVHGHKTATSIDSITLKATKAVLDNAKKCGTNIEIPTDLLVRTNTSDIPLTVAACKLTEAMTIIDIGPQTINRYTEILTNAATVFANGTMGIYEQTESAEGTRATLAALDSKKQTVLIAGGNATSAAYALGLQDQISFLSTGGGATLAYLGCQQPDRDFQALAILHTR